MKLLWATITLIVASLWIPDCVLAQSGARLAESSGPRGSSASSHEGRNPGPPWTRRASTKQEAGFGRSAATAAVTKTEMTRSEAAEDAEDQLLDKKIRSICRGC
jgi:hypothetical protein